MNTTKLCTNSTDHDYEILTEAQHTHIFDTTQSFMLDYIRNTLTDR